MKLSLLGKNLRKIASEFEEETKVLIVDSVRELHNVLPDFTKVLTGNAYSNWVYSSVFPDRIEQYNKGNSLSSNLSSPDADFAKFVAEYMSIPISDAYINNNANYILDIYDYGLILSGLESIAQDIARYKYKCL